MTCSPLLLAVLLLLGLFACDPKTAPAPAPQPAPAPKPVEASPEEGPLPWQGLDGEALRRALGAPVTEADVEAMEAMAAALTSRPEAEVYRAWYEALSQAAGRSVADSPPRPVPNSRARAAAQQALRLHHDEALIPGQRGGATGHWRRVARIFGLLAAAQRMTVDSLYSDRSAAKLVEERVLWRERWERRGSAGEEEARFVGNQVQRLAPMAALVLMHPDTAATWQRLGPERRQRFVAAFHTWERLLGRDELGALQRAVREAMAQQK